MLIYNQFLLLRIFKMQFTNKFIILLVAAGLMTCVKAASLSPTEQQIDTYLNNQKENQLLLLEKLVNINSGTENIKGVQKVGAILQSEFQQLGFKTQWFEEPQSMHKAATLVAEHKGPGKKILLIGHLDTVFPENSPFQKFERQDNKAIGPGVIDDKGGDVVLLYALKALKEANALDGANITVVLTGDEEESGKPASISRKPLLDAAKDAKFSMDFEDAVTSDTATLARRGITNWKLTTTGKEGHSSLIFRDEYGYGAIYEISRILNSMRDELSHEKYLTLSPGIILGGSTVQDEDNLKKAEASGKENVIPSMALARGDLRYISIEQKLKAEKNIQTIVAKHLAGTDATIEFKDGIPPMPLTAANKDLLQIYSLASQDLGLGAVKSFDPGARGAGDISYVANIVPANLAGLGPLGSGSHTSKETLEIDSLSIQTKRAALLIYRLGK